MNMTPDTKRTLMYDANKKSTGVAYLLWFFLGMLGIHRFYLGNIGSGLAILLLTLVSFVLIPAGVGLITIMIPGLWMLIDLFLIPGMVRTYNIGLINRL